MRGTLSEGVGPWGAILLSAMTETIPVYGTYNEIPLNRLICAYDLEYFFAEVLCRQTKKGLKSPFLPLNRLIAYG